MNELFQITSSAMDSQVKSELQLKDLNETVNFICTKHEDYEKDLVAMLEKRFFPTKKSERIQCKYNGKLNTKAH